VGRSSRWEALSWERDGGRLGGRRSERVRNGEKFFFFLNQRIKKKKIVPRRTRVGRGSDPRPPYRRTRCREKGNFLWKKRGPERRKMG
jgi:hypothetical protein